MIARAKANRTLTSLCLAIALAACQAQPATKQEVAAASTQVPSLEPAAPVASSIDSELGFRTTGVFDARMRESLKGFVQKVTISCTESGAGADEIAFTTCFKDKFMTGIEPSGDAQRYCPESDDIDASLKCAINGAMLVKLREKSGAPITPAAWKHIEGALAGEMVATVFDESATCTKEGKPGADAGRMCLAEKLITRLGGSEADGRACVHIQGDAEFGKCIGEGAVTSMFEALSQETPL